MKKTFEILKEVHGLNPTITHFLFRLYKHQKGLPIDPEKFTQYSWLDVGNLNNVKSIIDDHEKAGWSVGLASIVMTKKGIRHLLMLDYSIPPSSKIEKDLVAKISTFNASEDVPYKLDGYLIQTKNSYHYLGKYITSEDNLINFFGSALLFRHSDQNSFVVDDRWLGHSIKRRFGAIRLGQKEGVYPTVIKIIK